MRRDILKRMLSDASAPLQNCYVSE